VKVGRSEDFSNTLWWRVIEDLHLLLLLIGGGGGRTYVIGCRSAIAILWHVCARAACLHCGLTTGVGVYRGQMRAWVRPQQCHLSENNGLWSYMSIQFLIYMIPRLTRTFIHCAILHGLDHGHPMVSYPRECHIVARIFCVGQHFPLPFLLAGNTEWYALL